MKPVEFVIQETDEALVTHTGLAAIGALLGQTCYVPDYLPRKSHINVRDASRTMPQT